MATTRTRNASFKSTVVDAPVKDEQAHSAFADMFSSLGIPSGKRVLASFIISMLAGAITAYALNQVVVALAVGCAMLTGSAFITFIVMFMGYALLVLSTVVLSGKVQSFILNGDIDRVYHNAKSAVTGWLGSARDKASSFSARVAS